MKLWLWYFRKLIKEVDHYILRKYEDILSDYSIMITRLRIYRHWHHPHNSAFIFWSYHRYTVFTIWHWHSWYRFLIVLHWVIHCLASALNNKINLARVAGGRLVAGDQGGVLGRATPRGFGCHTWSCVLVIYAHTYYYMLNDTWVQWTASPWHQDPQTYHLIDMKLSRGMGHMMVKLV